MEPVFAYLAGLLTLINPCVLPVLPLVLASSLAADRRGPAALALGLSISFVAAGLALSLFGRGLGLDEDSLLKIGAALMTVFGAVLLVPRLGRGFATAMGPLALRADAGFGGLGRGPGAMVAGGALLGLVWAPCVGPTLGGALALAAAGQSLGHAALVMTAFAAGVSTVVLALGYGARQTIMARKARLQSLAERSHALVGAIFVLTGLALWFGWFRAGEVWLLDHLPYWLQDFSVRF